MSGFKASRKNMKRAIFATSGSDSLFTKYTARATKVAVVTTQRKRMVQFGVVSTTTDKKHAHTDMNIARRNTLL